jgi:hypothetical protein
MRSLQDTHCWYLGLVRDDVELVITDRHNRDVQVSQMQEIIHTWIRAGAGA